MLGYFPDMLMDNAISRIPMGGYGWVQTWWAGLHNSTSGKGRRSQIDFTWSLILTDQKPRYPEQQFGASCRAQ